MSQTVPAQSDAASQSVGPVGADAGDLQAKRDWCRIVLKVQLPAAPPGRGASAQPPARAALRQPPALPVAPPPPRPTQLQHVINERLMTFADLQNQIGHAPHKNKLGGAWKMSSKYKAVEREMGELDQDVTTAASATLSAIASAGSQQQIQDDLSDKIDKLIDAAKAYRKKHANDAGKRGAADALAADATRYQQGLRDQIDAVFQDPAFANVKDHLTLEQAMSAKRLGINFADCRLNDFNDTKLDASKSQAGFGAGKMNTVAKLVHADGVPRIFKPEPLTDGGTAKAPKVMGIDLNAPHYGNRNIASRAVADALGTDVLPKTQYAMHNGQFGMLMDMAPGESLVKKVTALSPKGQPYTYKSKVKPWKDDSPPSPKARASLHSQLNQLEWCDLITGQMDRQPENYMLDFQGDQVKVTGIDNDLAFGKNSKGIDYTANDGSTSPGRPQLIDKATLDRLKGLDFDRDIRPGLTGLLTQEEIDASRQRFALVLRHAQDLESKGLVVDDWQTWRAPDGKNASQYLADQKGGSLFERDFKKYFEDDNLM